MTKGGSEFFNCKLGRA